MNCDCAACRALADDIRANAEVLAALRDEPLPPLALRASRRRKPIRWQIAAAAAFLIAVALPMVKHRVAAPVRTPVPQHSAEPLKVKLLTPDPDVVIYWLIDPKENQSQ